LDRENLWRLPGAHGEEVVRSVYLDEQVCRECLACFISYWGLFITVFLLIFFSWTNSSIRVNRSSHVARMDMYGHGSLMREATVQSSLGLGQRRLGRRKRRRSGSDLTNLCAGKCICLQLSVVYRLVFGVVKIEYPAPECHEFRSSLSVLVPEYVCV